MQIKLDTILLDHKGKPIPNTSGLAADALQAMFQGGEDPPPFTLGAALTLAVLESPDQANSSDTKVRRWRLGNKMLDATEVELSVEDVAFLKTLVDKTWPSPIMVGRIYDLLDPPAVDTPPEVA